MPSSAAGVSSPPFFFFLLEAKNTWTHTAEKIEYAKSAFAYAREHRGWRRRALLRAHERGVVLGPDARVVGCEVLLEHLEGFLLGDGAHLELGAVGCVEAVGREVVEAEGSAAGGVEHTIS